MGHGRPRTAIGTFGGFTFDSAPNGQVKARVRYRDDDGQLRLVQATGDSRKSAERALKAKLSQRASYATGYGALSADSSFTTLVKVVDDARTLNAFDARRVHGCGQFSCRVRRWWCGCWGGCRCLVRGGGSWRL
jgi:hypothetical protein